MHPRTVSVMTIAGSDSGGGAGIQADLKTFAAHGVHGVSAIAALTAQNTRGVTAVHVPPTGFLEAQIEACFNDFDVRAVKLGMLANRDVIETVAAAIERYAPAVVVLDPVMVATSGARLLDPDALAAVRQRLVPLATLVTPNIPEAELLLDRRIDSPIDARDAGTELRRMGAHAALMKGGHLDTADEVVDQLVTADGVLAFRHARLAVEAHGTGCTLAAAVAARLARGETLGNACEGASDYIHRALSSGNRPGRSGLLVLDHFGAA